MVSNNNSINDPNVCLMSDNVTLSNGALHITAKKEATSFVKSDGSVNHCGFSSGYVQSAKSYQYGYFEIRAKMPVGEGLQPALWLYGANGRTAEIDLIDGQDTTQFGSNIFYWRDFPTHHSTNFARPHCQHQ